MTRRRHNSRRQAVLCADDRCAHLRLLAPAARPARRSPRRRGAPRRARAADGITRGTIYQRRARQPLPARRRLAVSARHGRRRPATSASSARRRPTAGRRRRCPTPGTPATTRSPSMTGTVGWYRKDFRLPDARSRMDWLVRFESVNYRSRVWLNGRPIGRNTGALPALRAAPAAQRAQAQRHEPARRPRRQPPPARPTSRRPG